jgi:mutator protein MutT
MIEKPHYHVAAGVIWDNGKLLITKRPQGSHLEGLWEFPGGKQEEGETLERCLAREVEEELGLEVRVGKPLLTVKHEYQSKLITLHMFNCTSVVGEARALENQEIRWVLPQDLNRFTFPPPDLEVLELILGESNAEAACEPMPCGTEE